MVFLTSVNLIRSRGPDSWWRKRKIFKLAAYFYGRRRNCYSLAIKSVQRALVYATKSRKLKKEDMAALRNQRILAGIGYEQNDTYQNLFDQLHKKDIQLNRKSLADLAIWEPSSYEALLKIAFNPIEDGEGEGSGGKY